MPELFEITRLIQADPPITFSILTSPDGHVVAGLRARLGILARTVQSR
ncbi:hypothetical protein ACWDPV_07740 [Gordonia sp. NPDC003504]